MTGNRWEQLCEHDPKIQDFFAFYDGDAERVFVGNSQAAQVSMRSIQSDRSGGLCFADQGGWANGFLSSLATYDPIRGCGVLVTDERTCLVQNGTRKTELGPAPSLLQDIAFDVAQVIGIDDSETFALGDDGTWKPIGSAPPYRTSTLAFDPVHNRLCGLFEDDDDQSVLFAFDQGSWVETTVRCPAPLGGGGLLAWDPKARGLVLFGGNCKEWSMKSQQRWLWISHGQDFVRLDKATQLPAARYRTAVAIGAELLVVGHTTLGIHELRGSDWAQSLACPPDEPPRKTTDDRNTNFAGTGASTTREAVFMLNRDGGLWCTLDGNFEQVAAASDGPGGRDSRRVALVWDAPSDRLVCIGGYGRNDTWIWSKSAGWRFLDGPQAWAGPAYVHWWGAHEVGTPAVLALLRRWHQRFGAELVCHWGTMLQFVVPRPPRDIDEAWQLATEQALVAPWTTMGPGLSVRNLARVLLHAERWFVHERP